VLTARTDGQLLRTKAPLEDAIRRANRYREAGADCLFVPGVNDVERIATLAREVDGPLNVVMGLGATTLTVAALRTVGVARMSLGGSIARAALGYVRRAARELREQGTLTFAEGQIPQAELNDIFARHERANRD
jgi:2-methylisocitrate lyase-like PEP mutase family enzyme